MKRVLSAILLVATAFGAAYASESACETLKAAVSSDALGERMPVFETPKAAPEAGVKQYDYNFRCLAGPQTPQYIAPTCYLYTGQGQERCLSAGCNWGFGGTPLPSFHCEAASFTPQYIAPTCYLYTGRGQQACVNAGCSWAFGTKSAQVVPAANLSAAVGQTIPAASLSRDKWSSSQFRTSCYINSVPAGVCTITNIGESVSMSGEVYFEYFNGDGGKIAGTSTSASLTLSAGGSDTVSKYYVPTGAVSCGCQFPE